MTLDIDHLRADTPACLQRIHFNNAGSSIPPTPVLDSQIKYLKLEAEIGGYEAADATQETLEAFYTAAAGAIGGKPQEIAFIENATRAWDMVFYAFDWQPGDKVLTSRADYNSNMVSYWQVASKYGVEIVMVPDDESGALDVAALERAIDDRVRLISVSHIPTNSGLVNPAAAIGAVATKYNIPYLLDACQSVGQLPIDVAEIGCTMLSTTGRKYIRGPRGTGFLWVREDWIERLEPPLLDNHAAPWVSVDRYEIRKDARRFENWESNFAGKIALGRALAYMTDLGMENIWARIKLLSGTLRAELSNLPGVTVWDPGQEKCGLITFTKDGREPKDIRDRLRASNINVSVSTTQLTRTEQRDHAVDATARASVHYYNTQAEIERFVEAIRHL
ncbi:aminotransferase class V-fold PLP-dependent enzyme [Aestuariispira ectoiniformans]|uniref:aminotransferase class V-fold PLP-dependent enzyme n=1 Tax=Aestuariispira ectoiniformans TaxID=2775080 RepID=UPI00223A9BD0|nr:aminotransferase class V-fold PLP-dependent enzyme [Aestuariispira ectoiniformans]